MLLFRMFLMCAVMITSAVQVQKAHAAAPEATVMTVGEMCGGCVKKITARLTKMPEVAGVKCDIATKTVTVTAAGAGASPLALWEAMEQIGKTPVKMVGPFGTFTEKPKN